MAKKSTRDLPKEQNTKQKPKRRFKGLVIALVALLTLGGVLLGGMGIVMWHFDYTYDDSIQKLPDENLGISSDVGQTLSKDITNIALFGLETRSRTSFEGLSDTIMIISIDRVHNKIKLTSVMRDSLVYTKEHGYAKINTIYKQDGPEGAIRLLNKNFNLNIREYATVNLLGMIEIIDAMGGVEVNVTAAEKNDANIHIGSLANEIGTPRDYIKKTGVQVLSGPQAVGWARIRHVSTAEGVSNDFGRTDRQRHVMEQLFNKALSAGVSQYPTLIKTISKYIKTSLSYSDILSMAGILISGVTFEQTRVPLSSYVIDGKYSEKTGNQTVYYNWDFASRVLHAFIYDDIQPEKYIEENGVDKSRWA